jgi:hypothetical protein
MKIGDDTMDRILVNKEVFEALTKTINAYGSEDNVMNMHSEDRKNWNGASEPLRELSIPDMARALYVGYDLRPTPEEAILSYYNNAKHLAKNGDHEMKLEYGATCDAVCLVLDELNIKIKGINA